MTAYSLYTSPAGLQDAGLELDVEVDDAGLGDLAAIIRNDVMGAPEEEEEDPAGQPSTSAPRRGAAAAPPPGLPDEARREAQELQVRTSRRAMIQGWRMHMHMWAQLLQAARLLQHGHARTWLSVANGLPLPIITRVQPVRAVGARVIELQLHVLKFHC